MFTNPLSTRPSSGAELWRMMGAFSAMLLRLRSKHQDIYRPLESTKNRAT